MIQRRSYHGFNEFEISKEEPLWKKYLGEVCVKDQIYYCFFSTAKSFSTLHKSDSPLLKDYPSKVFLFG
jgi:hypothetical protein